MSTGNKSMDDSDDDYIGPKYSMKDLLAWKKGVMEKKLCTKMNDEQRKAYLLKFGLEGDALRQLASPSRITKIFYTSGADKLAPIWRRRAEVYMGKIVENKGGEEANQCISVTRQDFVEQEAKRAVQIASARTETTKAFSSGGYSKPEENHDAIKSIG